jgi:hypothetical protein
MPPLRSLSNPVVTRGLVESLPKLRLRFEVMQGGGGQAT